MRLLKLAKFVAVAAGLSLAAHAATPTPLEDFFRGFAFDEIKISPDGTKVAALSKWKDHLNLYVIDLTTKKPSQITSVDTMDVREVRWVGNDRLLFTGVDDGYLAGGLFAIDVDGKNARPLWPSGKQQRSRGQYVLRSMEFMSYIGDSTKEVLVACNERKEDEMDVYRVDVHSGFKKRVATNPGNVSHWVADHHGAVRVGSGEVGRYRFIVYRDSADGEWREIKRWDFTKGDITPLSFDEQNKRVYVSTSYDGDLAKIALLDPVTGTVSEPLFSASGYDVDEVLLARSNAHLLGFSYVGERPTVSWQDPELKRLQALLDQELPGTTNVPYSYSNDRTWMVVLSYNDRDPGTFYLFNTVKLTLEKLVSRAPWIDPNRMATMQPIEYTARDGLRIHGYLTLPAGVAPKNLPLIVNPHGGPWARDVWGYNPEVQFLASRGYAVLQMNFRGSVGYGVKFNQAGFNQWGLAMQDDITDGVKWAVEQGIADPKRVAIYGASYGGYATMAGLAFTPELYRCGINYVGVTDIELLLKTIPKGWETVRAQMEAMTGNAEKDRDRLEATSPLRNADKVRVPVFCAYGELDERVDMKHATRLVSKLKERGVPVELMTRDNEGHGYRRFKNQVALYTKMEEFLAKNLQ